MDLPKRFLQACQEEALLPTDRPLLVACSGGVDSFVLLHLLWVLRESLQLELCVVSCDHGLRPESQAQAEQVRTRAWALGLPCRVMPLDCSQGPGESMEMAARRARLAAYEEAADFFATDTVLLGHHADDQAETLLLKLSRGCGPRGASGIRPRQRLGAIQLLRPLLPFRRCELEDLARHWRLPIQVDGSNQDLDMRRNRVRQELIPLMESRIHPEAASNLAAFTRSQQELEDWVSQCAVAALAEARHGDQLELSELRRHHPALQKRVLLGWLREGGLSPEELSQTLLDEMIAQIQQPEQELKKLQVPGVELWREQDRLCFPPETELAETPLLPDSSCLCPGLQRQFRIRRVHSWHAPEPGSRSEARAFCRMPQAAEAFTLRPPRPGDRYRPYKLQGSSKLSDLFSNAKLPPSQRRIWPVLCYGEDIVWVPGFRVAHDWAVQESPCLELELCEAEFLEA